MASSQSDSLISTPASRSGTPASRSSRDDTFVPATGLQSLDIFLMLGLVALAAVLVLIMSGWMGLLSNPLIGESRPPAGLEGLPPIERPRLPPPSRQSPDANDPDKKEPDPDRERWLASTSRPANDTRVVVRKPVSSPTAVDAAAVSPSLDPLAEINRLLTEAKTDRQRLEDENLALRQRIERLEKSPSTAPVDTPQSAAH